MTPSEDTVDKQPQKINDLRRLYESFPIFYSERSFTWALLILKLYNNCFRHFKNRAFLWQLSIAVFVSLCNSIFINTKTNIFKVLFCFLTAVSLHAGFAKAHGVNLLVASLNDPSNGVSGSGIYTPCSVNAYITATSGPKATKDQIKITPKTDCSTQDVLVMGAKGTDPPLSTLPRYNYDGLNTTLLTKNVDNQEYCNGSFCCSFTVSSDNWNSTEFYRAAVSDDQKVCGLLYCTDKDNVESCGVININAATTTFSNIVIKTTDGDDSFLPYILHTTMKPESLDQNNAKFLKDDDGANITVAGLSDVIAVGIVSTKSGASSLEIFVTSLIAMFFLLKQL